MRNLLNYIDIGTLRVFEERTTKKWPGIDSTSTKPPVLVNALKMNFLTQLERFL